MKNVGEKLISLNSNRLTVDDPSEDLRGRRVLDQDSVDLGKVNDLYLDERERKVRFLEVSSGGFLGLGGTKFLIPYSCRRDYINRRGGRYRPHK
jgi:uncharacterized protein YrrD